MQEYQEINQELFIMDANELQIIKNTNDIQKLHDKFIQLEQEIDKLKQIIMKITLPPVKNETIHDLFSDTLQSSEKGRFNMSILKE